MSFGKRLVRTRMLGVVGAGGEIPPATRLAICQPLCFIYMLKRLSFGTSRSMYHHSVLLILPLDLLQFYEVVPLNRD